jgi:hypothetical protein
MERPPASITTDALEQRLLRLESIVAAARAEQAQIVGELDTRQIPLADGCRSMREWLAGRLGQTGDTAGALTRLARSEHPEVRRLAERGELSFDQAVEADRLATVLDEKRAVEAAFTHDVAGMRRLTAHHRRISRRGERDLSDQRFFVMQPNLDRTAFRAWGSLPGIDGSVVEKALFERADSFPPLPDGSQGPIGQRMADALVSVCQDSLAGWEGHRQHQRGCHRVRRCRTRIRHRRRGRGGRAGRPEGRSAHAGEDPVRRSGRGHHHRAGTSRLVVTGHQDHPAGGPEIRAPP